MKTKALSLKPLAVMMGLLFTCSSFAIETDLKPVLTVGFVQTDNIELVESAKQSSSIGTIAAGIAGSIEGNDTDISINYLGTQAFYSHDSNENDYFNELSFDANKSFGRSGFSSGISASISNTAENSDFNASDDFLISETVETRRAGLDVGYSNSGRGLVNLGFSASSSVSDNEDDEGNSKNYSGQIQFEQGTLIKKFFWSLAYSHSQTDSRSTSADTKSQEINAELGLTQKYSFIPLIKFNGEKYEQSSTSSVFNDNKYAEAGPAIRYHFDKRSYIELSYLSILEGDQSDYFGAAINLEPTQRTSVFIEYGKRSFGESYSFNLSHQNKRWTNEVQYTEEPSSFDRDFYVSDQNVEEFWLEKDFNWTSTLTGRRSSLSFSLDSLRRERIDDDGAVAEDDRYRASVSISRNISRLSSISAYLSFYKYAYKTTDSKQSDYYRQFQIQWQRQFNEDLSLSIGASAMSRNSNTSDYAYDENRLFIDLNKQF